MFTSVLINGKKLAAERKRHGYNAADDLARKLGRATGTLRRYESSEVVGIDPDVLTHLAEAFSMSKDELWGKIGASDDEAARFEAMKRQPKRPKDETIRLPAELAGAMKALRADKPLTDLAVSILRDWLSKQGVPASSEKTPSQSGRDSIVLQTFEGGELRTEETHRAEGFGASELDAETRARQARKKTPGNKPPKNSLQGKAHAG